LENVDFRGRVMEYLGQKILPGHKVKSIFPSSDGAYLLWLNEICRSSERWRHDIMDKDGFTSQRKTAQMEKMKQKNAAWLKRTRVSEAQLQVNN
jgi:hypothetical protein